jgi:hypothetical protein
MATALITTIIALRNKIKLSFDVEAFWKSLLASTVMAMAVAAIQTYHYSKYLLPAYVFTGGAQGKPHTSVLRPLQKAFQA